MTEAQLKRLRHAVQQQGTSQVAEQLGISRESLARIMGGMPVRPGTTAIVERNMPKVKA